MEREFTVYKIISPAGDGYIGYTVLDLNERWRHHVNRALIEKREHPFYEAIRKYGPDRFKIMGIAKFADRLYAQQMEQETIRALPAEFLYNISPGGIEDAGFGGKIFWERLNADPAKRDRFLRKLSQIKKERDWSDYEALSKAAQKWRKENPREAYKLSHRAARIAARKQKNATDPDSEIKNKEFTLKERLMWKYKRADVTRENALNLWANRTEAERHEVGEKISKAAKERWSYIKDPEQRSLLTRKARESVDRQKQGVAASQGLKQFWVDLRNDPERYDAYMKKRTASLKRTMERKKRNENL